MTGSDRRYRAVDGIVVVDKPSGISSAHALNRVKKALGVKKAGHTGTLDPFATGVLICCLGKATRLARFFLHADKRYDAVMHLGVETDTQDLTGEVTARHLREVAFTSQRIREVMAGFVGKSKQAPPVYSALKHNGVPLYKLARKGTPVQKEARSITIHSLELLEISLPMVRFDARCSGGTYIRTLCADMGRILGCGGHLHALRRVENSGFSISDAVSLDELEDTAHAQSLDEYVMPMAKALRQMPEYMVNDVVTKKIFHGSALTWPDLNKKPPKPENLSQAQKHVKVVDASSNLLAVLTPEPNGAGFAYDCVFPRERT